MTTRDGRLVVFGGSLAPRDRDGAVAGGVGGGADTVDKDRRIAGAARRAYTG